MVTLKDIAREVGVNPSVVSRALNPKPDRNAVVSEDTKRRIVETAEALGYQRNRSAEFLKRGKTATIGAFMPAISDRLVADLMTGIAVAAAAEGFPLNFFFGADPADYKAFLEGNTDVQYSGIITYPYAASVAGEINQTIRDFQARGGHILVLNSLEDYGTIPVLTIDDEHGGRLAGEKLVELGCRSYFVADSFGPRARGFVSALPPTATFQTFNGHTLEQVLCELRNHPECRPAGFFTATDRLAMTMYGACAREGLTVGEDVRIIGYDDQVLMDRVHPSLTTVRQPFRELGERAVAKLISTIYGETTPSERVLPTLIVRESTGKPLD